MRNLRSLIYGVAQFFLVITMVGATLIGALAVHLALGRVLERAPGLSQMISGFETGLVVVGGLAGFAGTVISAAVIFALIEIAQNTRRM